jgi:hypothetical protein
LKKGDLKVLEAPRVFGGIDFDVPAADPVTAQQLLDAAHEFLLGPEEEVRRRDEGHRREDRSTDKAENPERRQCGASARPCFQEV